MKSSWKEQKLSEFVEIIMGQSPKSEYYNFDKDGVPFLQGNRTFGNLYPTYDTWCSNPTKTAKKNSVLMSVRAPVGDINIAPSDLCIGRGLSSLSMRNSNNRFLYYLLKANHKKILSNESGTVFGSVNKNTIENISVLVTSNEKEQEAIANILSSLDDKIELNNKMNRTLEEIAQTLYKRWFVDFEFPNADGEPYKSSGGEMVDSVLGLIPKGWTVANVTDLFTFKGGAQPPKEEHIYEYKTGYVRFIQNRDYKDDPRHLTFIKESPRNKIANKFDILIDKYGEVGQIRYGIEGAYNVALAKIDPIALNDLELLRGYFSQNEVREYLSNSSIASTRGSLNATTFTGLKIAYTQSKIKDIFSRLQTNILLKTLNIKEQNKKLSRIRDELLPKLMNGEIELPIEE